MPGIRVDHERAVRLRRRSQQPGAERHDLLVRGHQIRHVQVEVQLLRHGLGGPVGRDVIGRELHLEHRPVVHEHAVPVVGGVDDAAAEDCGSERGLGVEIRCVQDDDVPRDLHDPHDGTAV